MKRMKLCFAIIAVMFLIKGLAFAQDTTFTVTSAGNVGIGTTNPAFLLDVFGTNYKVRYNSGGNVDVLINRASNSNYGNLQYASDNTLLWAIGLRGVSPADGLFFHDEDAGTTRMMIDGTSGNVGIGTTNPTSRLHVHTNGATKIDLSTSSTTEAVFQRFFHSTNLQGGAVGFDTDDNVLKLVHGGNFNSSTKGLTISSDGSVGIGTTSPSGDLEVVDDEGGTTNVYFTAVNNLVLGGTLGLRKARGTVASPTDVQNGDRMGIIDGHGKSGFSYFSTAKFQFEVDGTFTSGERPPSRITFHTNVANTSAMERMRIDRDGNLGIGTTSPNNPLEMASGAHVTVGGVWTDASSRQYKENISNLTQEEAIAALEGLNPVKFNYKVQKDEQYVGFIAEDVPDLVATRSRKSLSPMDIVAVLTKVVQQQQKKITELEARLNASQ